MGCYGGAIGVVIADLWGKAATDIVSDLCCPPEQVSMVFPLTIIGKTACFSDDHHQAHPETCDAKPWGKAATDIVASIAGWAWSKRCWLPRWLSSVNRSCCKP